MTREHLMPDAGPVLDLHQAIYCACRDMKGGLTALAAIMSINYDTLQKKVSVGNETHHLLLKEFEEVVNVTNDDRIDEAYARMRGKVIFKPRPVPATNDALKALGYMLASEGAFVGSLHDGVEDNVWEPAEVEKLEHHGMKVICEVLAIMAGARQAMEDRSNG